MRGFKFLMETPSNVRENSLDMESVSSFIPYSKYIMPEENINDNGSNNFSIHNYTTKYSI